MKGYLTVVGWLSLIMNPLRAFSTPNFKMTTTGLSLPRPVFAPPTPLDFYCLHDARLGDVQAKERGCRQGQGMDRALLAASCRVLPSLETDIGRRRIVAR